MQGIGWVLNEEYYMTDDGTMANSTLLDYRMPTSLDLPMIDTVIVEVASDHPFGVRGVGEANIVPPTPAIANAVHSATGHPHGAASDESRCDYGGVLEAELVLWQMYSYPL